MKRIIFLLIFVFSSLQVFTQVEIKNLFFNSLVDITKLNFDTPPPTVSYTGVAVVGIVAEAMAHAEDGNGNVLFYVNSNGVYRPNNTLMPGSVGLLADPSSAEMNLCLIPGETDKYYVLYNAETCSPLFYSIVDLSLAGGAGDVSVLNVQIDPGFFGEGMELVRMPGTTNYWFVTYECGVTVKVFEINASGIQPGIAGLPTMLGTQGGLPPFDVRAELDYHGGKLAIACSGCAESLLCDFDPLTGITSNPIVIPEWAYGVEFSPDGSKLYLTHWYGFGTNLYQYDLNTNTMLNSYAVSPPGTQLAIGQIEMGGRRKIIYNL